MESGIFWSEMISDWLLRKAAVSVLFVYVDGKEFTANRTGGPLVLGLASYADRLVCPQILPARGLR